MKKLILITLLALLLLIPLALASDGCFVNKNCTRWAGITASGSLYEADSANFTVINPEGNYIIIKVQMDKINETFKYVGTYNKTGNYFGYTEFIKNGAVIDTALETWQVKVFEIGPGGQINNMNNIGMILGVGVFCVLLLIISNILGEKHFFWKLFTVLFVIFTLGIIVKASVDGYQNCNVVLSSTSTDSNGSLVYNYEEQCVGTELNTGKMFLRSNYILLSALGLYILVFGIYLISVHTGAGDFFKQGLNNKKR